MCIMLNSFLTDSQSQEYLTIFLKSPQNSSYVLPETLKVLSDGPRHVFFTVFIIIAVASLIGNISVIFAIFKRKYRHLQKTCIISLALSDILSTIAIGANNIEALSHPLINWTMGPFLCSFIPMSQFAGICASSIALVIIAMDRYQNVIHALSKRWNPSLTMCILIAVILWAICAGISYPMYTYFEHEPIRIVYISGDYPEYVDAYACTSFVKDEMKNYYVLMTVVIFLPLLLIFIWFYYKIAALIWKHRKPVMTQPKNSNEKDSSESSNSISASKSDQKTVKFMIMKNKNIRVERKIRTFKIIVTLMFVFILCRLPYHVFCVLKFVNDYTGATVWYVQYSYCALNIINCALNPLLYTFINATLGAITKFNKAVKEFSWEICCFFISNTEFVEFEKDNPFVRKDTARIERNCNYGGKFEDVHQLGKQPKSSVRKY